MAYRLNLDRINTDTVATASSVKQQADELRAAEADACNGSMGQEFRDILRSRRQGVAPAASQPAPRPLPRSKTAELVPVQPLSLPVERVNPYTAFDSRCSFVFAGSLQHKPSRASQGMYNHALEGEPIIHA